MRNMIKRLEDYLERKNGNFFKCGKNQDKVQEKKRKNKEMGLEIEREKVGGIERI